MKKQVLDNPMQNQETKHTNISKATMYFIIVVGLLITCYITSNVMSVKILNVFNIPFLDNGTIIFPLTYMLGDVLTEVWGFKTAKKVIFITLLCNIFFIAFTSLGIILPTSSDAQAVSDAYKTIFLQTPRILGASLVAFIVGEFTNSFVLEKLKQKTNGKHLWLRTIGSSVVGHFLDTAIFLIIAFVGIIEFKELVVMILIQYVIKLGIEALCATPFAYLLVNKIKKHINKEQQI